MKLIKCSSCNSKKTKIMFKSKRDYSKRTVYFARYECEACVKVFDVPLSEEEYQNFDVK